MKTMKTPNKPKKKSKYKLRTHIVYSKLLYTLQFVSFPALTQHSAENSLFSSTFPLLYILKHTIALETPIKSYTLNNSNKYYKPENNIPKNNPTDPNNSCSSNNPNNPNT